MTQNELYTLGIDIGSTTVKIAILDETGSLTVEYQKKYSQVA